MQDSNLKDIKIKTITLNLDKERRLKFDLNAFAELQDKYGGLNQALDSLQKALDPTNIDIKALRYLLWLGLINEDEALTERQVGKLIDLTNIMDVIFAISEAFGDSLPDVKNLIPSLNL